MKGEPIVKLDGTEFAPSNNETLREQILRYFNSQGGSAESPFGTVLLDNKSVKNDLAHPNYLNKTHSFAAVKDVLEKGNVSTPFGYHMVHGKKQPTGIIRGYILIGEQPFRMEVTVIGNADGKLRLYCHDVYQIPLTENRQKSIITRHVLEESDGFLSRNPFGDVAKLHIKNEISKNLGECSPYRITQSQLCRIVESAVKEVLNRQQLNEIYFHKPGVEKRIGEYEVVDGNLWDGKVDGIRDMGWVQDIRLYSSDKPNGRTYALYKRCDNGKFFFVEVVDDENNPKKSKAVRIKSTDVPEPIVSDALSLVRRDRKGLNLFS